VEPIVCCVGDLFEDLVVRAALPPVRGADVPATIARHRGGSAANTAATVSRLDGRARFVGHVGADDVGDRLLADLAAVGVECIVTRGGRSGTVVVVVEPDGERTMFSDRGSGSELGALEGDAWFDGVAIVHAPFYTIAADGEHAGAHALLTRARHRGVSIALDPSSAVLADRAFERVVRDLEPEIVFCNTAEAAALGVDDDGLRGATLVVVKQGDEPVLLRGSVHASVAVPPLGSLVDTTGAGDAFAGGFLLATIRGADPIVATFAGHAAAARVVRGIGADAWLDA
jgi:sugar/nucleoside kinase (ribokinase family)